MVLVGDADMARLCLNMIHDESFMTVLYRRANRQPSRSLLRLERKEGCIEQGAQEHAAGQYLILESRSAVCINSSIAIDTISQ